MKVGSSDGSRQVLLRLLSEGHGRIIDTGEQTITVEVTGNAEKLQTFLRMLEPFGIRQHRGPSVPGPPTARDLPGPGVARVDPRAGQLRAAASRLSCESRQIRVVCESGASIGLK